ncbi:MAG: hypothetical protein H6741_17725 [Alphaproteobacteria bacterium]|nr:hypothetical protein [Alphaproteobacteria bacterium]MCB9794559.1 hypothetical protein [Alphaproteobacteria bacterium]
MSFALIAFVASAFAASPSVVYFNGDAYQQSNEQGRYLLDGPGPFGGDCYTQEGGSHSLFTAQGDWIMIDDAHCAVTSSSFQTALYPASSDPRTTPYVDCEPDMVELTNLTIASDEGDYELSAVQGDSDFACYNRVGGGRSFGSFYGTWRVLDTDDCDLYGATWIDNILPSDSCDPTDDFVVYPLY